LQAPPVSYVESYLYYHRQNGMMGGTIRIYIGVITSVCNEFYYSEVSPASHQKIRDLIKAHQDVDGTESTASFDMFIDLPKIYDSCWAIRFWSSEKRLMCWVMFLLAICIMARASDMTQFCPKYEDILLPPAHLWDIDGFPKWIDIGLTSVLFLYFPPSSLFDLTAFV